AAGAARRRVRQRAAAWDARHRPVHRRPAVVQDTPVARLKNAAATIDFPQDLDQCVDVSVRRFNAPVVARPRRCDLDARLDSKEGRATLQWSLDPSCIAAGVDRSDASLAPSAALPDQLTLLLLTKIGDLPFDPGNFAASGGTLPWTKPGTPADER